MAVDRGVKWNREHPTGGAMIRLVAGIVLVVVGISQHYIPLEIVGGLLAALEVYQLIKAK